MRLRWKIMRLVNLTVVITLFLATLNISIALSMSETQEANETVIEMGQTQNSSFDPIDDPQYLSSFEAYPSLIEPLT
ncbi:MAG: hypothetical protein ABUK18_03540 [Candidatus Bathyarchaeia archaeon]|jgi:hypothetical protein